MGKGHKRRAEDFKKVQENWEYINWGKKSEKQEPETKTEKQQLLDSYLQEQ